MSSILKALRKVEEEKRTSAHVAPDLRSDQGARAHSKKTVGSLLTGMLLGAVCVVFFLFVQPDNETVPTGAPAVTKEVKNVVSTPEPVAVKPMLETIPVVTLPPEPVAVETQQRVANKPAKVSPDKTAPRSIKRTEVTRPLEIPVKAKATVTAAPLTPPSLPENISLKVTEIFFQPDPADRMAVVNDLPVMVGTPVDGAQVQEILSDHVVFNFAGKDYPVYLSHQ